MCACYAIFMNEYSESITYDHEVILYVVISFLIFNIFKFDVLSAHEDINALYCVTNKMSNSTSDKACILKTYRYYISCLFSGFFSSFRTDEEVGHASQ